MYHYIYCIAPLITLLIRLIRVFSLGSFSLQIPLLRFYEIARSLALSSWILLLGEKWFCDWIPYQIFTDIFLCLLGLLVAASLERFQRFKSLF
jgi:hypothetical protein